jgi:hypothetical protein
MNEDLSDLLEFLEPSGTMIEELAPTSWGGHIPFMFCLMNYMRPRTYVELGTHHGGSFFAVCQAIRDFRIPCAASAVDLWLGDEHAGKYGEAIYKRFRLALEHRYPGVGHVIRKDFTDAAALFGQRTLDLVHIDGLHTYEAARNDYETWLPKLSPHGVILFHDTNVRENGFGVWRLWEEIKNDHASFNFTHTHGLGVIALGSPTAPSRIASLLRAVNRSNDAQRSFDHFFRLAGERAVSEAISRRRFRAVPRLIIDFLRPFSHAVRER